jgi:hypothetical protein
VGNFLTGVNRFGHSLDLMADGPQSAAGCRVDSDGVVAVHYVAGCPEGQSRTNVLALGEACVRIC